MEFTNRDLLFLRELAFAESYYLYSQNLLETVGYSSKIFEIFLIEASSVPTENEANELWKELEMDKHKVENEESDLPGSSSLDGFGRLFAAFEFTTKTYQKIAGSAVLAWPIKWFIGKIYNWMKLSGTYSEFYNKQLFIDRAIKYAKAKGLNYKDPNVIGKIAKQLQHKDVIRSKIIQADLKKLKATNTLWSKIKYKFRKAKIKYGSENITYKLSNLIEKLLTFGTKHPIYSGVIAILVLFLIMITIFKWDVIKKYLNLIFKILTAPFRYFYRGIKWIFNKLSGSKNQ